MFNGCNDKSRPGAFLVLKQAISISRMCSDKLYPSGSLVKFRHPPTIVEPGCAMTLDLGFDIGPPGFQLRRRFRQRATQNCFDLVKRQFDLFCASWPIAKPILQG